MGAHLMQKEVILKDGQGAIPYVWRIVHAVYRGQKKREKGASSDFCIDEEVKRK